MEVARAGHEALLRVRDDGIGIAPEMLPRIFNIFMRPNPDGGRVQGGVGVGLVSMRERAEELGGTWSIEPVESGGTRVLARLPLVLSETTDTLVVIPTGVPQEEE